MRRCLSSRISHHCWECAPKLAAPSLGGFEMPTMVLPIRVGEILGELATKLGSLFWRPRPSQLSVRILSSKSLENGSSNFALVAPTAETRFERLSAIWGRTVQ